MNTQRKYHYVKSIKYMIFILLSLLIFSSVAEARRSKSQKNYDNSLSIPSYDIEYQNGYFRKNGTYVNSHFKTKKNKTKRDNYSTYPNINPYTGKKGNIKYDYDY